MAAYNEIEQGKQALDRRAFRPGVTHLRRGAGMALNAVLVLDERPAWGRSYMEHVTALATDEDVPTEVRAAARFLHDTTPAPPALVQLGKPDLRPLEAARQIVNWARERVDQLSVNG